MRVLSEDGIGSLSSVADAAAHTAESMKACDRLLVLPHIQKHGINLFVREDSQIGQPATAIRG